MKRGSKKSSTRPATPRKSPSKLGTAYPPPNPAKYAGLAGPPERGITPKVHRSAVALMSQEVVKKEYLERTPQVKPLKGSKWWQKLIPVKIKIDGIKRQIYHEGLEPEGVERLIELGYDPIDVRNLPTDTVDSEKSQVFALLQGISEGTIEGTQTRVKSLEVRARALGMLDHRRVTLNAHIGVTSDTLEKLLDFGPSRFLLRDTTVQKIRDAEMASIIPGLQFGIKNLLKKDPQSALRDEKIEAQREVLKHKRKRRLKESRESREAKDGDEVHTGENKHS
jgi:hypothetical protein